MLTYYRHPPYLQSGRGIGNILKRMYNTASPVIKTFGNSNLGHAIGTALTAAALTGVKNIASDALLGKDVRKSIDNNFNKARMKIAKSINPRKISAITTQPNTRKRRAASVRFATSIKKNLKRKKPGRPPTTHNVSLFRNDDYDDEDDDSNDDIR